MSRFAIAIVAVAVIGSALRPPVVVAAPEAGSPADGDAGNADRAFAAAAARAAASDPAAIDAFEAIGGARPLTRWSDDAWAEAARLAERAGDFARARHDLEQVIAIGSDDLLVRRAHGALDRLTQITGSGTWDRVAADHERLASQLLAAGDPRPALAELEALVAANPGYPRATVARIAIAQAWERDGNSERALATLHAAVTAARGDDLQRAELALARTLIHAEQLGEADALLATLEAQPGTERVAVREVRESLVSAEHRRTIRHGLAALLAAIVLAAGLLLRRDSGSWRAAGRRLAHPPTEVWFLVPIAAVLAIVASTGNPLVARAVRTIAIAGVAIGWLSGSVLEAVRQRAGRLGLGRTLAHALVTVVAVGTAVYLVLDHDRLIDLVIETWREGPAAR